MALFCANASSVLLTTDAELSMFWAVCWGGALGRRWAGQVAITCAPLRRVRDVWPAEVEDKSFGRSIGSHVRQRLKAGVRGDI